MSEHAIGKFDWDDGAVTLRWSDGRVSRYHHLWLRDNCACETCLHPQTLERTFDLLSVDEDIRPESVALAADGALELCWPGEHLSRYDAAWLSSHCYTTERPRGDNVTPVTWDQRYADDLHSIDWETLAGSETALHDWLLALRRYGLSRITNVPCSDEGVIDAARRIAFLRQTNFGVTFDVQSKPKPNNVAYTGLALPLHTDLANQEMPPGFQLLHCLANDAEGGESTFADGFEILRRLRAEHPEDFDLLANTSVPFRFHDDDSDIRFRAPIISIDEAGEVTELRYNAHLVAVFDAPGESMPRLYRAYRKLMALVREPALRVELKMKAGDLFIFDNRRVLHGRRAFSQDSGRRHLRGCYVDRGDLYSRQRVLARRYAA